MASVPDLNRRFAQTVAETLHRAGYQALFAGGCVRDILLARMPKDYDVATDATPDQVRDLFGHRRTLAVGASFGVIVVIPTKADRLRGIEPVEVATFRTEGAYHDGRRPSQVAFATAEEDAKRRDFTINGMFLDPVENKVLDFVGGQSDLAAGMIRAIGEPHERMAEDKLRLLRAVRFAATLGFRLDERTATAIREMASQLVVVSAERITEELRRMLVDEHRRQAMQLCEMCGLLAVIFPDLKTVIGHDGSDRAQWNTTLTTLQLLEHPSFALALAALLHPLAERGNAVKVETICRQLRLSNADRELVVWLLIHREDLEQIQNRPRWFLKRLGANAAAAELIRLVKSILTAEGGDLASVEFFERFLTETPPDELDPPLLLTGDDLIGLGFRPGPRFKEVLAEIRNQQLDEAISTRNDALKIARQLHENATADTNGAR